MTENEKLRALLAEARAALSQGCWNGKCCAVRARIDAALAEPVEAVRDCICTGPWTTGHQHTDICREFCGMRAECERQMEYGIKQHEAAQNALRERDEARAEVERLRSLKPIGTYSLDWNHEQERLRLTAEIEMLRGVGCQTADKIGEPASGPCGACRKCAYQRGAEAMREAAAVRIDAEGINGCTGPFFGNIIRALPIPEDKP